MFHSSVLHWLYRNYLNSPSPPQPILDSCLLCFDDVRAQQTNNTSDSRSIPLNRWAESSRGELWSAPIEKKKQLPWWNYRWRRCSCPPRLSSLRMLNLTCDGYITRKIPTTLPLNSILCIQVQSLSRTFILFTKDFGASATTTYLSFSILSTWSTWLWALFHRKLTCRWRKFVNIKILQWLIWLQRLYHNLILSILPTWTSFFSWLQTVSGLSRVGWLKYMPRLIIPSESIQNITPVSENEDCWWLTAVVALSAVRSS